MRAHPEHHEARVRFLAETLVFILQHVLKRSKVIESNIWYAAKK